MSERPDNMDGESRDEIIAGEYVLGVLSLDDRRRIERRIAEDPAFAMRVRRWQDNLETLDEDYGDIKPPAHVFSAIEARLFAETAPARQGVLAQLWTSVAVWRVAALAGIVLAVGMALTGPLGVPKAGQVQPLVADLSAKDSPFGLVAAYDRETGLMRLTAAAASGAEPKVLELWLVEADQAPVSLGLASQDGMGEFVVPAALQSRIAAGVTLAVSLEPPGGSPTGSPTGPVVAAGQTRIP